MPQRPGGQDAEPLNFDIGTRPRHSRGRVRWTDDERFPRDAEETSRRGNLIREFLNTPLWSYRSDTAPETLLRHWHVARRVMVTTFCTAALMFTSMLEFLLSEPGWWRALWMWMLIGAGAIATIALLPMAVIWAWAGEIERECGQRGILLPYPGSLEVLAQRAAMKTVLYAGALVLVVNILGRSPEWRPLACGLAVAITLWTVAAMFKSPARAA